MQGFQEVGHANGTHFVSFEASDAVVVNAVVEIHDAELLHSLDDPRVLQFVLPGNHSHYHVQ